MSRRRVFDRAPARLILALASAVLLCGQKENARAQTQEGEALSQSVRAVFDRSKNAVVKIEAADEHGALSGTGFFVDPNGTLYTCYSVGGESHDIVVCQGDAKYPATRLTADPRSGIAILKIEPQKNAAFLKLGKSRELGVASMVVTVGFPLNLPVTPNFGCVGGFDLKYGDRFFATSHIRANVPVQRGEGGAPLLNMRGEAVGILVSSLEGGVGCFALPIEAAEKVRQDFMRFGEARPGWLGIQFGKNDRAPDGSGVRVEDFVEDAPAAKAGLEKGDVLLQVGDTKIQSPEDVLAAAFYLTAGDEVSITVLRGDEKMTLNVQPADVTPRPTAALPAAGGIPLKVSR